MSCPDSERWELIRQRELKAMRDDGIDVDEIARAYPMPEEEDHALTSPVRWTVSRIDADAKTFTLEEVNGDAL